MDRTDYQVWAEQHAKTFGLTWDGDLEMVLSWAELFQLAGYSADELADATRRLFGNAPAKKDHLVALQDCLRRQREERNSLPQVPEDFGQCSLCGSSGMVVVPHPKRYSQAIDGQQWYTCAVACRCPMGRWVLARQQKPMLSLDQYEERFPDWRERQKQRDAWLAKLAEVRSGGKPGNDAWDALVSRLLASADARRRNGQG